MQNSTDLMMLHDMKRDDTTYKCPSYACMWRSWMRTQCCQYFIPKAWADIDGYGQPTDLTRIWTLSKE